LNLTLEDVKLGREGIRDAWMHTVWATNNGWDLAAMGRERPIFLAWLAQHTGTPARFIGDGSRRYGIAPPSFGVKYEQDPSFVEACASVRYRARFANKSNSVVYLADCECREELTAGELKEVSQTARSLKPVEPHIWHTEGFSAIYRRNRNGRVVETLRLANEFRALCLLLAESPDQTAQYSEIQPKIGTCAHRLDIAAGGAKPAQKGERRVRDLLRTKTGRRLVRWGVLKTTKAGREKFLELSASKVAE
jgi:hypothetical protein